MLRKLLSLALIFTLLVPTSNKAIFCTAHHYIHPESGKEIWFLGDVHFDIDEQGSLTNLQRHALLDAAQRLDALVLAENCDVQISYARTYAILSAFYAFFLYKSLRNNNTFSAILDAYFLSIYGTSWYQEYMKDKKPSFSIADYLAKIYQRPATTKLRCSNISPLFALVAHCKQRNIRALDVEFRNHTITSRIQEDYLKTHWYKKPLFLLARAENWLEDQLSGAAARHPISVADYWQDQQSITQELAIAARESAVLERFVKESKLFYSANPVTKQLKVLAASNKHFLLSSMPQHIARTMRVSPTAAYDLFAVHNTHLLDARMAAYIYQNRHEKSMFVCAGAAHIERLAEFAQKIGYKEKAMYGKNNLKYLRHNVLNVDITSVEVKDIRFMVIDLEKIFKTA